jgi:predicted transcriptional regulator
MSVQDVREINNSNNLKARYLTDARVSKGLSVRFMANSLGVTNKFITDVENEKRVIPLGFYVRFMQTVVWADTQKR